MFFSTYVDKKVPRGELGDMRGPKYTYIYYIYNLKQSTTIVQP